MRYSRLGFLLLPLPLMGGCHLFGPRPEPPLQALAWPFGSGRVPFSASTGLESRIENGVLVLDTQPGAPACDFTLLPGAIDGPVVLGMRLRVPAAGEHRFAVRWRAEGGQFDPVRELAFSVEGGGHWRDVTLPIAVREKRVELGIVVPPGVGRIEIDEVRIDEDRPPRERREAMAKLVGRAEVEDDALRVEVDLTGPVLAITERTRGRRWEARFDDFLGEMTAVRREDDRRLVLELADYPRRAVYTATIELAGGGAVLFNLSGGVPPAPFHTLAPWPPRLESTMRDGRLVLADGHAGLFLRQEDPLLAGRVLHPGAPSPALDMPWVGVVDHAAGDGMMLLLESPARSGIYLRRGTDGSAWPQVLWATGDAEAGTTTRTVRATFTPVGGGVAHAKLYRQWLARPEAAMPALAIPAGPMAHAPLFAGTGDARRFSRRALALGVHEAILADAAESSAIGTAAITLPPGHLPLMSIPAVYLAAGTEGIEAWSRRTQGLLPPRPTQLAPQPTSWPEAAPAALAQLAARIGAGAVAIAADPRDGQLLHQMGRSGLFDTFARTTPVPLWLPAPTEAQLAIAPVSTNRFEGPSWWYASGGWSPLSPDPVAARADYPPLYRDHVDDYRGRLPLWQLVHRDRHTIRAAAGDAAVLHRAAAPEVAERRLLYSLLYGMPPAHWRRIGTADWPQDPVADLLLHHETAWFLRRIAGRAMTNFEILSQDHAVQRATFDGGYTVLVNFGAEPRDLPSDSGRVGLLASGGYLVTGPDFEQSRLMSGGSMVVRLESPEVRLVAGTGRVAIDGLGEATRLLALVRDGGDWQLIAAGDDAVQLNVGALAGLDPAAGVALLELDAEGRPEEVTPLPLSAEPVTIVPRPGRAHITARLMPDAAAPALLIHPPGPWIDEAQPLRLSTALRNVQLHYTTDRTEPTLRSARYTAPFPMPHTGTLRVALFRGREPVGTAGMVDYRVTRRLHHSAVLRTGDAPTLVDVRLTGLDQLRLLTGDAGDDGWGDALLVADPVLFTNRRERVGLVTLPPATRHQAWGAPLVYTTADLPEPLRPMASVTGTAIVTRPESELTWRLDGDYSQLRLELRAIAPLEATPGSQPAGTVTVTIEGVLPVRR